MIRSWGKVGPAMHCLLPLDPSPPSHPTQQSAGPNRWAVAHATPASRAVWCVQKDDASKFEVIIDNLLNLELLFWAGKHTNNATLTDHATAHALKTGELWLRDDNSTAHLCVFNPETGVLATPCTGTPQGYSAKSTWSRGQAWGIYGWTLAHRYTGDPRFVGFAERAAKYYMANADPKTLVPLWDFQAPANESWPDTSAAAITASALFELSAATGKKAHYDNAVGILNGLVTNFVVSPPSTSEAVFFGNKHDDLTVTGGTIIETEYYTFEAIRRLMAAV
jgi:unsaturated chondroitin disaccharide hydrolase